MSLPRPATTLARLLRSRMPTHAQVAADARRLMSGGPALTRLVLHPEWSPFAVAVAHAAAGRPAAAATVTKLFAAHARPFSSLNRVSALRRVEAEANKETWDAVKQATYARALNESGHHTEVTILAVHSGALERRDHDSPL